MFFGAPCANLGKKMAFYNHYTSRSRNKIGIKTKLYQAEKIFNLGLPKEKSSVPAILEIGPGDGYIANLSESLKYKYLAIEGSSSVARKIHLDGHEVINAMVPPLPSGIGRFDVCYMLHVIEHMKDMQTAEQLLREIKDQLSEGGRLVIACPDYVRWQHRFYDCDYTHSLPFTQRRLRQLLANEGFRVIHQSIYIGPVFGYVGLPFYWMAKLLYPQFVDDYVSRLFKGDIFNRAYLTLIPNLIFVAERDVSAK